MWAVIAYMQQSRQAAEEACPSTDSCIQPFEVNTQLSIQQPASFLSQLSVYIYKYSASQTAIYPTISKPEVRLFIQAAIHAYDKPSARRFGSLVHHLSHGSPMNWRRPAPSAPRLRCHTTLEDRSTTYRSARPACWVACLQRRCINSAHSCSSPQHHDPEALRAHQMSRSFERQPGAERGCCCPL